MLAARLLVFAIMPKDSVVDNFYIALWEWLGMSRQGRSILAITHAEPEQSMKFDVFIHRVQRVQNPLCGRRSCTARPRSIQFV